MPSYQINEAVFALPELGFVDRTLHRLEFPPSRPGAGDEAAVEPLGVEIRRLPAERGKRLRELVDADVAATKVKVDGLTILDEVEVSLGGAPTLLLRARYRARDVAFYQLKAHALFAGTWMTVVVTAPYAERARCDATFERIVQSLQWRIG